MSVFYAVFLHGTPISVYSHPSMAINEAKERSTVSGYARIARMELLDFLDEEKTDLDCVPCSHALPCDNDWKTHG